MIKITSYGPVTRFDISRTLAGRGHYWTSAYLINGMLIDTGCAHAASEFVKAIFDKPVSRIVNTHSHEDHIGGNHLLHRGRPGLEILAHPLALAVLADPRRTQPLHPYRRLFWGWPGPSQGKPINDNDQIVTDHYCFRIIYTPGHSQDHLCLYVPEEGWLFTGDLFVGGRDRALRAGYDIWKIIDSLKHIANLRVVRMFPGSARVRDKPGEDLVRKIDYLETLGERVLELHQQGRSVSDVVRAVCGGPMWIEFVTLGHFSRRHLVLSYLGQNRDS
jgi:glyoxylase-like metal-dependent hydrolase (beta-lactamase superfamily II)